MKKQIAMTILGASIAVCMLPAQARDTKYMLSIPTALESTQVKSNIDGSIKLYFGSQVYAKEAQTVTSMEAHGKMPAGRDADISSCYTSFAEALKIMQRNAKDAGANAVVNIVSNYQKRAPSSNTEFECHAGSVFAHVMLKGTVVKIAE